MRPNFLHILESRIADFVISCVRLWFWPFDLSPRPVFSQKYPKSVKSNPIFHLKGRGDRVLAFTYFDSSIAEFFGHLFTVKQGVKVGPKRQTSPCRFRKSSSFSKIIQIVLLYTNILSLVKISVKSDIIWGNKSTNPPKKGQLMNAELVGKTLKTFNMTATNAIRMLRTTNIYLYKVFNFAKSWGVNHWA